MQAPLDHADPTGTHSGGLCPRTQGYTPLVRETAGMAFGNPGANVVTWLMCNQCGTPIPAPVVDHPAMRPSFRAP